MGVLVGGDSPPGMMMMMSVSTMERSLFALMGALEEGDSPPGRKGCYKVLDGVLLLTKNGRV